ncbi:hypothetical protein TNCV_2695241 [Trichonephila clavipes]|nr:hypothetical protein TNCV_2695241 [Trichonephila clavipes]
MVIVALLAGASVSRTFNLVGFSKDLCVKGYDSQHKPRVFLGRTERCGNPEGCNTGRCRRTKSDLKLEATTTQTSRRDSNSFLRASVTEDAHSKSLWIRTLEN